MSWLSYCEFDKTFEFGEMEIHLMSKLALFEACGYTEPHEVELQTPDAIVRGMVYGNRALNPVLANVRVDMSQRGINAVHPQYYLQDKHANSHALRQGIYTITIDQRLSYHVCTCPTQRPKNVSEWKNAKNDIISSFIVAPPDREAWKSRWYGNVLVVKTFNGNLVDVFKGDTRVIDGIVQRLVTEYMDMA